MEGGLGENIRRNAPNFFEGWCEKSFHGALRRIIFLAHLIFEISRSEISKMRCR
jgi:hypothetical protein